MNPDFVMNALVAAGPELGEPAMRFDVQPKPLVGPLKCYGSRQLLQESVRQELPTRRVQSVLWGLVRAGLAWVIHFEFVCHVVIIGSPLALLAGFARTGARLWKRKSRPVGAAWHMSGSLHRVEV